MKNVSPPAIVKLGRGLQPIQIYDIDFKCHNNSRRPDASVHDDLYLHLFEVAISVPCWTNPMID